MYELRYQSNCLLDLVTAEWRNTFSYPTVQGHHILVRLNAPLNMRICFLIWFRGWDSHEIALYVAPSRDKGVLSAVERDLWNATDTNGSRRTMATRPFPVHCSPSPRIQRCRDGSSVKGWEASIIKLLALILVNTLPVWKTATSKSKFSHQLGLESWLNEVNSRRCTSHSLTCVDSMFEGGRLHQSPSTCRPIQVIQLLHGNSCTHNTLHIVRPFRLSLPLMSVFLPVQLHRILRSCGLNY